ncbi:MAG: hypothetical protein H5T86_14570, partial [Armatimonadetes bacterium]|nr:hypothetical protein [Armatimonadota bacterium]
RVPMPGTGVRAPAVVHLRPELTSAGPRLVITQASVGRISLPDGQVQQLQKRLDESVKVPTVEGARVSISGIYLTPGAVVVQGNVAPRR